MPASPTLPSCSCEQGRTPSLSHPTRLWPLNSFFTNSWIYTYSLCPQNLCLPVLYQNPKYMLQKLHACNQFCSWGSKQPTWLWNACSLLTSHLSSKQGHWSFSLTLLISYSIKTLELIILLNFSPSFNTVQIEAKLICQQIWNCLGSVLEFHLFLIFLKEQQIDLFLS